MPSTRDAFVDSLPRFLSPLLIKYIRPTCFFFSIDGVCLSHFGEDLWIPSVSSPNNSTISRMYSHSSLWGSVCSWMTYIMVLYQILASADTYFRVCFHAGLSSDVFMVLILYMEVFRCVISKKNWLTAFESDIFPCDRFFHVTLPHSAPRAKDRNSVHELVFIPSM